MVLPVMVASEMVTCGGWNGRRKVACLRRSRWGYCSLPSPELLLAVWRGVEATGGAEVVLGWMNGGPSWLA